MPTKRTRRKSNNVRIQFAVSRRGLPGAASFQKWAALVPLEATLRIVGAAEGRRLNRQYRKKAYPTNVLSFPYGKDRGDVVLCHPVIAREAREWKKALAAHYAHLVIHGMLHLRGLRHGPRMERRETRLLARFGLADPYTVE